MRTDGFNGILLSILITVSLIAPAITTISILSVNTVSASPAYENVVRGYVTAYSTDHDSYPPQREYAKGDRPIIMAAEKGIGAGGAVIAAGIAGTMRNTRWNASDNPDNHLDVLLDEAFKWAGGGTQVLWYEGHNTYNNTTRCEQLVDALVDLGYTISTSSTEPITAGLLAPYDILILAQLEEGDSGTGGNPDLVSDSEVSAIENFVKISGKTLLIVDQTDTFGHNYARVQNKILKAIWYPEGVYFQSDSVFDDDNMWGQNFEFTAGVENIPGSIGAAYGSVTGKTRIGVYTVSTLADKYDYDPALTISPLETLEGLPGGELVFTIKVSSLGWNVDNITLAVSDDIWSVALEETEFGPLNDGEFGTTTLTITIPGGASFGDNDEITLTATSVGDGSFKVKKLNAIASSRVYTTTDDTQVSDAQPEQIYGNYIWMWATSTDVPYNVLTETHRNTYIYMKFDLRGIPSTIPPKGWTSDNLQARLYAYNWGMHMTVGKDLAVYSVTDDSWTEETENWTNKPAPVDLLDKATVVDDYAWYSWDVTDFVRSQLGTDNFVSFVLKAENDYLPPPEDFAYEFYPKENPDEEIRYPYIAIGYDVDAWITPAYGEGMPGGTVSYTVRVMNRGSLADNYLLSVIQNNWVTSLSSDKIEVQPGEIGEVDLYVTIPSYATPGVDNDNVLILAESEGSSAENDTYWCITQAVQNWIRPAKDDSATKSTLRLENSTWGRDIYEFGAGRDEYLAYPGYYYDAGPTRGWLKFDLRAIGTNIARATLNLYNWEVVGAGATVNVHGVENDDWSEATITWTNMPSIGDILDTRSVTVEGKWYSWDVTSFVTAQIAGDNIASFSLVDLGENIGPDHAANFTPKEFGLENQWPYLEIESQLPDREVRAYAAPIFQGGVGTTLTYTITVMNTGTLDDNYDLTFSDDILPSWNPTLDNILLEVPAGENRTTTLNVTIPSVDICTTDNITITVTSQENSEIYDNIRCSAHRSGAPFVNKDLSPNTLRTLYEVWLDLNVLLRDDASELVLKFYTWGGGPRGENVVSTTLPALLDTLWKNYHPWGTYVAVERAELVLEDAQGTEIQTITTFIVTKGILEIRFSEIPFHWALNFPPGKTEIEIEFMDIPMYWALAQY